MIKSTPILILILPFALSSVTIPTLQLFRNSLKRWNTPILNHRDHSERWENFLVAKESVERSTSGIVLQSLNAFSVLNQTELAKITSRLLSRSLNITHTPKDVAGVWTEQEEVDKGARLSHVLRRRGKRDTATYPLPPVIDYWENVVGLHEARNQASCGSCWSFPNIGTLEVMNKDLTGDTTEFSEQFYVNCRPNGISGCAGGVSNDGFKQTMKQQYLMSAEFLPYTADYKPCEYTKDITTFKNNAFTKIWLQDWYPVGNSEYNFLKGLLLSPVSLGTYVGKDFFHYSGGILEDRSCVTNPSPHALLLVGYTQSILRIKNSYGTSWGDNGYANYKRGSGYLLSCNFYKSAFAITVTYRREMEYTYCNSSKVVRYKECAASCSEMNTATQTGWSLAVIPTEYHNNLIVEKLTKDYPGIKPDDKFNYFWMGLLDKDRDMGYTWADSYTPVNYWRVQKGKEGGKWGLINKNSGSWITKNTATYKARGLCSRAKQCWNFETAVQNGTVTFSQADLREGTKATVACSKGCQLKGAGTLTCTGGVWDKEIPTCTLQDKPGMCVYTPRQGSGLSLAPSQTTFTTGETLTASCISGSTSQHTCNEGGVMTPPLPSCKTPRVCVVVPDDRILFHPPDKLIFLEGDQLKATCVNNTHLTDMFTCTDGIFVEHFNPGDFCSSEAAHVKISGILTAMFLILVYL